MTGTRSEPGDEYDHDVIAVGGGPADCSGGVFCAREGDVDRVRREAKLDGERTAAGQEALAAHLATERLVAAGVTE